MPDAVVAPRGVTRRGDGDTADGVTVRVRASALATASATSKLYRLDRPPPSSPTSVTRPAVAHATLLLQEKHDSVDCP